MTGDNVHIQCQESFDMFSGIVTDIPTAETKTYSVLLDDGMDCINNINNRQETSQSEMSVLIISEPIASLTQEPIDIALEICFHVRFELVFKPFLNFIGFQPVDEVVYVQTDMNWRFIGDWLTFECAFVMIHGLET